MRIHPPAGMILERYVPEGGVTLNGIYLPEHTVVGIGAWVVHQDKATFGDDCDVFRPERWLEAEPEKRKEMDRAFFPVRILSGSYGLEGLIVT